MRPQAGHAGLGPRDNASGGYQARSLQPQVGPAMTQIGKMMRTGETPRTSTHTISSSL